MFRVLPVLGQTLGPYRLLAGIELGGRAAVFRAIDERSQRPAAVKVPIEGALAGEVVRARLRREALALGSLDHPGVPALLGSGSEDGIDFLALELVAGRTLADRLREEGPLDEAAARILGSRLAAVLAAVHRRGIVHCDLKPGNVILAPDGGVKILDFGQARRTGDRALDPGESFIEAAGTVSYMAPERFQRRRPDPRADLWSLGVLLYESATGRRPFRGDGPDAVIRALRRETPEPPSAHAPRLSPRFDRIVLKALEKDPDRRYASAQGISQALRRLETDVERRKQEIAGEGREREERLRAALFASGTGTFRWDIRTNTLDWDEALDRLFGLPPGETARSLDQFIALVHPDDRQEVVDRCSRCRDEGADFDMELRVIWPDGSEHWLDDKGKTYLGDDGRPAYMTGACVDVTERIRKERTLRFLSDLNQATQLLADPEEIMAICSRRLGEHLGVNRCAYAERESDDTHVVITQDFTRDTFSLAGRFPMSDFGDDVLLRLKENEIYVANDVETEVRDEAALATFLRAEIRAVIGVPLHKGGRWVAGFAIHQKTPRRWTRGEIELVQQVAGRCWDSIERARATRGLRESEQRLRLAQRAGRVGVFEWLLPEDRVNWSPELEHLYGVPEGTFEGSFDDWRKRVVPEDAMKVEEGVADCLRRRQTEYSYEFRAILPDGTRRWLAGQAQFFYDETDRPLRMIGVNVDIAEQRRSLEERERLLASERAAREEAERISRLKDEFLATLSHELRTPLNAILGWAQLLQRTGPGTSDLARGLETIERNARVQTQLIDDLLDMSRIISGKVRLDVQPVDLAAVVQAAVEAVQPSVQAKELRLRKVLDPHAGPVSGDPGRLQQVVWNLLSNAVKFTPRGGTVEVLLERVNSHLEISVSDSGVGIHPDFLPYVFERFRQADSSSTRKFGGLGLGLSIVKQLVELHGGSVRAKSAGEGRGATFIVALPLTSVSREAGEGPRRHPRAAALAAQELAMPSLKGLCVLVIDDERDSRELVQKILEECEAEVDTAGSAAEGLEAVRRRRPDVLLSDIGMPEQDGHDFIRAVRALGDEYRQIPAVALTAFARSDDRRLAMLAGFQVHLAKPVEAAELCAVVASLSGRTG